MWTYEPPKFITKLDKSVAALGTAHSLVFDIRTVLLGPCPWLVGSVIVIPILHIENRGILFPDRLVSILCSWQNWDLDASNLTWVYILNHHTYQSRYSACLLDPQAPEAKLRVKLKLWGGYACSEYCEIQKIFLPRHFIKEAVMWLPVPWELKWHHLPHLNSDIKCEIPQTPLIKAITRINIY